MIKEDSMNQKSPIHVEVFGASQIEHGAMEQIYDAAKLPVSLAAALMPDAHQGYGLPIGGVLATDNAVIPYGVGVDIGCRVALSIYEMPHHELFKNPQFFRKLLLDNTLFGAGRGFKGKDKSDHPVLENNLFKELPLLRKLKDRAWSQLGTSGGGNHFAEFGVFTLTDTDPRLNLEKGEYLALLTHSGSRGLGANIANHFTKVAKSKSQLDRRLANLSYLSLDSEDGQTYWNSMELAGDYASACHQIIHEKIHQTLGSQLLAKVENHHNFAWKEIWKGQEVIVHRKGATPASKGTLGFIPGSMVDPGFLVRGKGIESGLNSAAHGAGRQMSRRQAFKNYNKKDLNHIASKHEISLIGAGIDEIPMAYKNIHQVMRAQEELIEVLGQFDPKVVRMADDGSRED